MPASPTSASNWLTRLRWKEIFSSISYFLLCAGKVLWENDVSFLRIKVIFLALYCHSPTFAVNDIVKFVNTCFTFISYQIWPRHLQFRCTKAVRRYLKRPPFFEGATVFWGGHRWPGGPPVAPDGKRHPYIYIYIYIYISIMVYFKIRNYLFKNVICRI